MVWKQDGALQWLYVPSSSETETVEEHSQPYVVSIAERNPQVDYFASHPPEHPVKGDIPYTSRGFQVEFGRFAGAHIHLGFRSGREAVEIAKKFMRKHKTLLSLRRAINTTRTH